MKRNSKKLVKAGTESAVNPALKLGRRSVSVALCKTDLNKFFFRSKKHL